MQMLKKLQDLFLTIHRHHFISIGLLISSDAIINS